MGGGGGWVTCFDLAEAGTCTGNGNGKEIHAVREKDQRSFTTLSAGFAWQGGKRGYRAGGATWGFVRHSRERREMPLLRVIRNNLQE